MKKSNVSRNCLPGLKDKAASEITDTICGWSTFCFGITSEVVGSSDLCDSKVWRTTTLSFVVVVTWYHKTKQQFVEKSPNTIILSEIVEDLGSLIILLAALL